MLELTCVFVLTVISFTSSTPHGYGVKSGALANAQAGSTAGAYAGGNGGAFSGSFSKASSSSFAASSASSSSSSFGYSGTGVYSGSGFNSVPNGSGCATGSCQNGPSGHSGGANNAFSQSGSIAGTASQAAAQNYNEDGSPCVGGCLNKPTSCVGLNCGSNPNKCVSGNCGDSEKDDIFVNNASNKPSNSKPQYPNTSTSCASGNCGVSSSSHIEDDGSYKSEHEDDGSYKPEYENNYKPEDDGSYKPEGDDNLKPENDSSYKPNYPPSSSGPHSAQSPKKPSIFISLPKETSPPGSLYSSNLPSSYNVPIHAPVSGNIPQGNNGLETTQSSSNSNSVSTNHVIGSTQKPKCNTPVCETHETDYPNFVPLQEPKNQLNCVSGNCAAYPSEGPRGSPSPIAPVGEAGSPCRGSPNCAGSHPKPPTKIYETPSYAAAPAPPSCATGQCGGIPSVPPPSPSLPNYSIPSQNSANGCASGDCGRVPFDSNPTSYNTPTINPPAGLASPNCVSGNCAIPSGPSSLPNSQKHNIPSYSSSNNCPSGNCGVASINSKNSFVPSTGPATSNCLSGNCGNIPSVSSSNLNSPNYNVPKPTSFTNGCTAGNCDTNPNYKNPSHSPSNNYPTAPAPSNCVSGQCGSVSTSSSNLSHYGSPTSYNTPTINPPAGLASPNCVSGNCAIPSGPSSLPNSLKHNIPSYSSSNNCPSGNCVVDSINSKNSFAPPTGPATSNCLSGNCGNIPSVPSSNLNSPNYNVPTQTSFTNGCTAGNCDTIPNSKNPSHSPSNNYPTAPASSNCVSGQCGGVSTSGSNLSHYGSHVSSSQSDAGVAISPQTKPVHQKQPIYTGGFGGPSGFLKPNDYTVPSKTLSHPTPANPIMPTSSLQGITSPVGLNENHSPPSAVHTPSAAGTSVPHHNQVGTLNNAVAGAVASASAAAYSGGFGGPPGFLKPYDGKGGSAIPSAGSKYQSSPTAINQSPHENIYPSSPGSSGSYGSALNSVTAQAAGSGAGAVAQAGSAAGGLSVSYGGQTGHGGGGCSTGCGSGKSLGGTAASAGAYSFASASASAHASAGAATKGGYGRR